MLYITIYKCVVKLSSSFNHIWTKTVGGEGYDDGYDIQELSDTGFIVAGYTNSYGSGSEDGWIIRLEEDETQYTSVSGSAFTVAADNVTTSTLNIPDSGNITDVNITISGSEACGLEYLDMTLQSPYGTIVELTNINTMSGSAFSQTTFDDEASDPISSGIAPYFGSFQPEGSLSDIDQEEMQGTWTLWVYNSHDYNHNDNYSYNYDHD